MAYRYLLPLVPAAILFAAEPIRLHPENPHYFLFRGKPAVLVTSGEHYGAVLNADFNYRVYLDELARHGLNHTRTFAGTYREVQGNFGITRNTLAPAPERFVCPWPRSSTPGAVDGGAKFDLDRWNPEYFARLRDFVIQAGKRGVAVELNLFCPFYEDSMWNVNPMNARNNVNGAGAVPRAEVLTLKHSDLVRIQEAFVRKVVEELKSFDNLYYEIINEPYAGNVPLEWQHHIARLIRETETRLGVAHLISQNISNGSRRVEQPFDEVSLLNFHYSRPPDSVAMNYHLNRAIGNNETGFDGTADATYRIQGWEFLMAGGALYNNLDYSFAAGNERGDFAYPEKSPGGGSAALRAQLGALKRFLEALPFLSMKPEGNWIRGGVPAGASIQALASLGKVYAAYLHHGRVVKNERPRYQVDSRPKHVTLEVDLPAGRWKAAWVDPVTGRTAKQEQFRHAGGVRQVASPEYGGDIALRMSRN